MMPEFLDWSEKVKPEIAHVSGILANRLSDEPEALISDLQEIEAWNGRVGALLAQADSWLDRYTLTSLPSRDGRTEADRKAVVESETSPIRLMRDTLEHFCDCIKQRLILGESILSYHKQQYAERKTREPANIFQAG